MTSTLDLPTAPTPVAAPPWYPLSTFAIGFGLAGLAGVWTRAGSALSLPRAVPQAFWAVAAVAWLWLLIAHAVRGARSGQSLAAQLRHPAQGPLASLAPVTAILLAADLFTWSPTAGRLLYFLALAASTLLAAWLLGSWLRGGLDVAFLHPGYLLPTVAPGLIGADVGHALGYPGLAWALFGVGSFFTVVMTAVVLARLMFLKALPDALLPSTMILLAPPAVGGLAWFSLNGHTADPVAHALAGLGVLVLLVQAAMLPRYRELRFSLGFWSFTFPLAAAVGLAVEWLHVVEPTGWRPLSGVLVAAFTAFIAVIAFRSLRSAAL